ncbi:MAG: TetR/AcrR family transcriptional regulator [Nitrospirae bacterium]|nr:TetR/AcrR family transcriptional regulator [Candidatus Manganitrophaceae bacterium]
MGRTSDAKARILRSAQELFYARSTENVGVQEICDHAGVKKGSFYHYFPSKQKLTLEVAEDYRRCSAKALSEEVFCSDIPPLQRIEGLFQYVYLFHKKVKAETGKVQGCLNVNLSTELSTQEASIREKICESFSGGIAPIEAALSEAVEKGDLREMDTQAKAEAIFVYLQGAVMMAKAQNDPEVIFRLAKEVKNFVEA